MHEPYDPALPGKLRSAEALLGIEVPDSHRDAARRGARPLVRRAAALSSAILRWRAIPVFDLESQTWDGVVEVDPETFELVDRLGTFPSFVRGLLEVGA